MHGRLTNLASWLPLAEVDRLQIILIHDKKDEMTGVELRRLLAGYPKGSILLNEGIYGNPGGARNAGLEIANGDWIVFWDCDDRPKLNELLSVIEEAEQEEGNIAISSFETCQDGTGQVNKIFVVPDRENLLPHLVSNPGIWRFAFRKEVIKKVRFPESRMGEDQAFISAVGIFEKKIYLSSKVTYRYYYGEATHLTNQKSAWEDLQISITEIQKTVLRQTGLNKKLSQFFLMKQIITCVKRCKLSTKMFALGVFLYQAFKDLRFIRLAGLIVFSREAIS
jgi:glycosyltransferase involved in cell wall biosynthesis